MCVCIELLNTADSCADSESGDPRSLCTLYICTYHYVCTTYLALIKHPDAAFVALLMYVCARTHTDIHTNYQDTYMSGSIMNLDLPW
jgi:hypothetical protein